MPASSFQSISGAAANTNLSECCCTPTKPVPTNATPTYSCPNTTANITGLQPTAVSGTTLEWHNVATNPSAASLQTPTAVGASTYYLYAKNNLTGCYSDASTPIVVAAGTLNCADKDGDGVADFIDIDDDNDGILDTIECPSLPGGISGQADALTWNDANLKLFAIGGNTNALGYVESGFQKEALARNMPLTILNSTTDFTAVNTGNATTSTVNFANGNLTYSSNYVNAAFPAEFRTTTSGEFVSGSVANGVYIFPPRGGVVGNKYTVDINFTTPVTAFSFDLVDIFDIVNSGSPTPTFNYKITIDGNVVGWFQDPAIGNDVTGTKTLFDGNGIALGTMSLGHNTENTIAFISSVPVSNVKIEHEFISGTMATGERDPHGLDNFVYSTAAGICDTDNDGIINSCDLDSDGDGCSDAVEAGVVPNSQKDAYDGPGFPTNVADANNDGINDAFAAGNYSAAYSSYALDSSNTAMCVDKDNDGVADFIDIDDDNDGVLDALESGACSVYTPSSVTTTSTNVGAGRALNLTIDNSLTTFGGTSPGVTTLNGDVTYTLNTLASNIYLNKLRIYPNGGTNLSDGQLTNITKIDFYDASNNLLFTNSNIVMPIASTLTTTDKPLVLIKI